MIAFLGIAVILGAIQIFSLSSLNAANLRYDGTIQGTENEIN